MMAFDQYLKLTLEQAAREAEAAGATSVEAQHLLLAMAAPPESDVGRFLEDVGLGHASLRAALDRDAAQALKSVGVSLDAPAQQRRPSTRSLAGHVGTSVQLALERGLQGLREAPRPAHLLLGVLLAEVGSVPRAISLLGIDRTALIEQVRKALLG